MDRFHVSATGHSPTYFPHYLAEELGYFTDVDLNVTIDVPKPWDLVLDNLNNGVSQAALGGIWVPAMYKSRVKDYLSFAQLCARYTIEIVTREPVESFDWNYFTNKLVLVGGLGAGPGRTVFLKGVLKHAGIDLSTVRFIDGLSTSMFAELFGGGQGDAYAVDTLTAAALVRDGIGYHTASVTNPVPASVYYTLPEVLNREDNLIGRFTLAIQRATTWIREHDAEDARDLVKQNWPDDVDRMIEFLNMYKHQLWDESVLIKESELLAWQQSLAWAGLIEKPFPYTELVTTKPYEFTVAQLAK
ncbi:ABC transporter substrate-binding protein [Paenibacillus beijingensis]|uniref:Thiamine pyrimidine synthase n=1 Tax=Paenibacillus beijingensis TaxID=1126833 RepID=A0A0D5NKY3_9BACL|nr:ABC transporter substrate-binding protein [Paenibacillus beijingensis]AJY75642.1 hypothetical protein VN24_15090 [Paenibacillus beijingensis]